MKRIILAIFTAAMLLTLCACGSDVPTKEAPAVPETTLSPEELAAAKFEEASALYEQKDYVPAYALFEELAEETDNAEAFAMLGYMCDYTHEGIEKDYEKAIAYYGRALELDSSNARALTGMAQAYIGNDGDVIEIDYEKAMEYLPRAAEQDYSHAFTTLGQVYTDGLGVEVNYTEARKWYTKAAEKGDASGMNRMGYLYFNGFGVKKDNAKAFEYMEKAAEGGHSGSMDWLAYFYATGCGVDRDCDKAYEWAGKYFETGEKYAFSYLVYNLWEAGYREDAVTAAEKSAETDGAAGLNQLGYCYERAKKYSDAFDTYTKAAEMGNVDSTRNIGLMYANGEGVKKNLEKACEWYDKAYAAGKDTALLDKAYAYYKLGSGKEALKIAMECIERNIPGSNNAVGYFYGGKKLGRKYKESAEWLKKGVEAGEPAAYYNLGLYTFYGRGVHKDKAKAIELIETAEKLGYEAAQGMTDYFRRGGCPRGLTNY